MTYPQLIQDVKSKGYYAATSVKDIRAEYDRLVKIREDSLIGDNLYEWRCVRALVETKLAVTALIERGLRAEDIEDFTRAIEYAKNAYHSAKLALEPEGTGGDAAFEALGAAVGRAVILAQGVNADFGKLISDGEFRGTIADFTRLVEKYGSIKTENLAPLFPEADKGQFAFLSVKKAIYDLLQKKLEFLTQAMFAGFSLDKAYVPDTISQYDSLQSLPALSLAQGVKDAPVLFVCTPIRAEFDIMLNANLNRNGIAKILQIELSLLPKAILKSADSMARFLLFAKRSSKAGVFAFYGIDKLSEVEKGKVYAAVTAYLRLVAEDVRMVFWDKSGDMQGMKEYERIKGETPFAPAENRYLRLPSFADACELLAGAEEERKEEIRVSCVFMGYRGLNYLYATEKEMGLAIDTAKRLSDENAAAVLAFLSRLPDDSKLVPLDWRYDSAIDRHVGIASGEYDYDEIRAVSDDRIRAILANDSFTIYEKCGELVRYILLADEDKSVWKEVLTDEERRERIERATHVVAYAMKVYHRAPKVLVVDLRGAWGGLCCNGGAEIKYKKSASEDIAWLMDAILHELYHSLQYTLVDTAVDPTWHKKAFHISNERIASWHDNFKVYVDLGEENNDIYMIQSVEVDARDFAGLCLGDQVYHEHDRLITKRGEQ